MRQGPPHVPADRSRYLNPAAANRKMAGLDPSAARARGNRKRPRCVRPRQIWESDRRATATVQWRVAAALTFRRNAEMLKYHSCVAAAHCADRRSMRPLEHYTAGDPPPLRHGYRGRAVSKERLELSQDEFLALAVGLKG